MKWPDVAFVFRTSYMKLKDAYPNFDFDLYAIYKEIMREFDIPIFVNFEGTRLHVNVKQNQLIVLEDEGDVVNQIEIVRIPATRLLVPTSEDDFYANKSGAYPSRINRRKQKKHSRDKDSDEELVVVAPKSRNMSSYDLDSEEEITIAPRGSRSKQSRNDRRNKSSCDLDSEEEITIAPRGSRSKRFRNDRLTQTSDSESELEIKIVKAPHLQRHRRYELLSNPRLPSSSTLSAQPIQTTYEKLLEQFLRNDDLMNTEYGYLRFRRINLLIEDEDVWNEDNIRRDKRLSDLAVTANIMARLQPQLLQTTTGKRVKRNEAINPRKISVLTDRPNYQAKYLFPNYAATIFAIGYRKLCDLQYWGRRQPWSKMMTNVCLTVKLGEAILQPIMESSMDITPIINGPSLPEAVLHIWNGIFTEFSVEAERALNI